MPKPWSSLIVKYRRALKDYLARSDEANLQRAYELGRVALNRGLGVLDMARLHQEALIRLIASAGSPVATAPRAKAVETFLFDALSPFEAAHRGFREACGRLQKLNQALEQRIRQARDMEEALRQLSNKVLTAQEEERKYLSRELHDEIGQALTAVSVTLALMKKQAGPDAALRRRVAEAQKLLAQSAEVVHRFACELRPDMLDHLGLQAALRSYVKSFVERTAIQARLHCQGDVCQINGQGGAVLFRVVQESLTNVFKHARATRVEIKLQRTPSSVCLEVSDNGRAFCVEDYLEGKRKNRLGLLGMQERVRLIHGEFAVESAPGRGTTVRVRIPWSLRGRELLPVKPVC